MKRLSILTIFALAVVVAACPAAKVAPPVTHTLTVHADASGVIDESHHDPDPHISWKDRIEWTMECHNDDGTECDFPKKIELRIENVRHEADLTQLDKAERGKVRAAANAAKTVQPDYKGKRPNRPSSAFENGLEPQNPNNKRVVRSTPYRAFDHEHLWKFTWVILIDGREVDRWDPHFSGRKR